MTGTAATAPVPCRAAAMTGSMTRGLGKGRAPSCTSTIEHAGRSWRAPPRRNPCGFPARDQAQPLAEKPGEPFRRGARPARPGARRRPRRTSGWERNGRSARSKIGTPASGRNCLGLAPHPARSGPRRRSTTPTSRGKGRASSSTWEMATCRSPGTWAPCRGEAKARRNPRRLGLRQPALEAGRSGRTSPPRPISPRYSASAGVGRLCRLESSAAATARSAPGSRSRTPRGDLDEDIEIGEPRPAPALQHREQHGEALGIDSRGHALRRAVARGRRERLHLHQHRAGALHQRRDRAAAGALGAGREKHRRRIGHRGQARARSSRRRRARPPSRTDSWSRGAGDSRAWLRPRSRGRCPRCARASSARRWCRPWSRAPRRTRRCRSPWRSASVARRTRAPGPRCRARSRASRCTTVWIESRTSTSALSAAGGVEDGFETGFAEHEHRRRRPRPGGRRASGSARAIPRRWRRARAGPRPRSRAAVWSSSVDLPMPGSPPISAIEPGHDAAAQHEVELGDAGGPADQAATGSTSRSAVGRSAADGDRDLDRPARPLRRLRRHRLLRHACSTPRMPRTARPTWSGRGRTRCSDRPSGAVASSASPRARRGCRSG